jgi:hypothetical protein
MRREVRRDVWAICNPLQPANLFLFGRREKDQHLQLFLNVVEVMLQLSIDENHRARVHLMMVGTNLHPRNSAHDVIHFVLAVGFLRISSALGQNVDARAHRWDAEKLKVRFVLPGALTREIVDVKKLGHTEN